MLFRSGHTVAADIRNQKTDLIIVLRHKLIEVAGYRRHQPVLVALNEMAGYDPLVGATYRNLLTAITGRVTRVIEDGQADGSIRPELPATATASALTWMVERACHQNLPTAPASYDAELAEALAQIIWGTLYLKPMPSPVT